MKGTSRILEVTNFQILQPLQKNKIIQSLQNFVAPRKKRVAGLKEDLEPLFVLNQRILWNSRGD